MFEHDSKRLIQLLENSITLYKKDREMAVENYEMLRDQLKQITTMQEMSEEGKLEKEVNLALKNVFLSGERLDAVIQTLSRILINSMHAQAKVEAAKAFNGMANGGPNEKVITAPIDLTALLAAPDEEKE